MSIERICIRDVDTAEPHETINVIAQRMHQRAVGSLIVVDDANHPIGIVTDRDLMERVLSRGLDSTQTVVRDVMSTGLKTINSRSPIEAALSIMRNGRFRRVPVVNEERELVGMVALDDILMLLASEFTQIGRLIEQERPRNVITA
jgi:CBS domain-containing protein